MSKTFEKLLWAGESVQEAIDFLMDYRTLVGDDDITPIEVQERLDQCLQDIETLKTKVSND
jgi:hypothetical protein